MKSYKQYLAEQDYKGEHEAPDKDNGAPLYDLSLNGIFPKDFYEKGVTHYGDGDATFDSESFNVILSAKNKPNKSVMIYRAVPDINKDITTKITELQINLNYYDRFNFFPVNNKTIKAFQDKYYDEKVGYVDDYEKLVYNDIVNEIDELKKKLDKPIKINNGDWVTLSKSYAKEHGKDNLNNKYKIIRKTVKAKTLFNDGNSINEFGYWEN